MNYELAVVIPTLNERSNIHPLLESLDRALQSISWEAIFVDDDSTDQTTQAVWAEAAGRPNVRCIRRIGRRGLAAACIEGMLASGAPYLAVMDADLQHDESLLPRMLRLLQDKDLEIVVASRFAAGSSMLEFSDRRERLSRIGNWASRKLCRAPLSDPLSGFFMLRRALFDEVAYSLSGLGFKLLVDIFASARRTPRYAELPFAFRPRQHGSSKLDLMVLAEFGLLICDKTIGRFVPARFVAFLLVGLCGVGVHLAVLAAASKLLRLPFATSYILATTAAIVGNYYANNSLTFRIRRRKGRAFFAGLIVFYLACGFGAIISYKMATTLYSSGVAWLFAGAAGAFVGGIWNFNMASFFVWNDARPHAISRSQSTNRS